MDGSMIKLSDDAKAILLLCGRFGKSDDSGGIKPLTLKEYNRLADWMVNKKMRPSDLLGKEVSQALPEAEYGLDAKRIRTLLSRGTVMALYVEKWIHNGLWIVCRSDEVYPERLKKHLKRTQAPPILFGVGNIDLLTSGGLAVVGSRNLDKGGEVFTQNIAETCAREGMSIVSGAARGVDQIAMISALNAGGPVVGVMADGLLKASVSAKYRDGIREKRLVLVSPYHPESRFTVGNAMGRNKLIYALSDYALVISAEKDKGGTWAGAKEELKRTEPKPVFVRVEDNAPEGNQALIKLGARTFPDSPWDEGLRMTLESTFSSARKPPLKQALLFGERSNTE
jgi:predicted Rossmann fold nucleotide-binding protein DprA/Smf involved in DNA uptake